MSKISPYLRTVIQETANKNIKMKVLEEVMNGKYPDLGQLYKLATTKTDPISVDWNNAAEKYPGWAQFNISNFEDYTKPEVLTYIIQFVTGKKISNSSASIDAFNKLHELAVFGHSNIRKMDYVQGSIKNGTVNYPDIVKVLKEMPTTQLISDLSTSSKYTVASPKKKTNDLGSELSKHYKTLMATSLTSDKLPEECEQFLGAFGNLLIDLLAQVTSSTGSLDTAD